MLWFVATALAQEAGQCQAVKLSDITSTAAPGVIVLGERHGTEPDLRRAYKVVKTLEASGHVTVALESVHEKYQSVLDDFATGKILETDLEAKLEWTKSWGFAWEPYKKLVEASKIGAKVIAAGEDLGVAPADANFPVPAGYFPILRDSMAGHDVSPEAQDGFIRAMAWRDYKIASDAVKGWDGNGWLVIDAGRGHVEGGKGVQWQAAQLTKAPVSAFVLAWGDNPPCYAGDKLLK